MMKKMIQRGFTLIELLVVIAIIGILAAVVLASLNDARDGGLNASIQQTMASLRSQAEVYYNTTGSFSYDNLCSDTVIIGLIDAAMEVTNGESYTTALTGDETNAATNDLGDATLRTGQCNDNSSQYMVTVPMAGGDTAGGLSFWCIDSEGNVGEYEEVGAPDIPGIDDQPGDSATTCE